MILCGLRKMRIYIFIEHYPSLYKPYFDTQLEDFLNQGHQLKIFSVKQQGNQLADKVIRAELKNITTNYPATLKHVPSKIGLVLKNALYNPIWRIKTIFKVLDLKCGLKQNIMNVTRMMILPVKSPDICLIHNLTTATQFTFIKKLYKETPIVLYYHGGEVSGVQKLDNTLAKRAFDYADIILTNTKNSRQHAINRGAEPGKVKLNPVGFDLDEFHAVKLREYRKDGVLKFILIGRISQEKGFIYALQAINQLVKNGIKNIHFSIVGDGHELSKLKDYVKQNQLDDYVDFPGHEGNRARLYERISHADGLILPSIATDAWEETQGCVLQEAMLLKTLVLTSTTGGIPESIAPEMTQFSFPPEDPQAIVDSISRVMALDNEELNRLGEHCRNHTRKHYAIGMLNQNIINYCMRVAEN